MFSVNFIGWDSNKMSLSSLRYQAAKQRFNTKKISKSVSIKPASQENVTGTYDGFNPETGKQKFKTKSGDTVEAVNNNQHSAYATNQSVLISQNHVIG